MTGAPAIHTERAPTVPGATRARRPIAAPDRERLLKAAVVAVPCAIAAALALYEITARSLWLDEAASVAIASQHGVALWHAMEHDGGNMLAYYALLHLVTSLFGDGTLVIRLPSALATVATVAMVCLLAQRLFGRRVALTAGVLTGVSLPLVYWGQDGRSYALMMTFITASFLAFVALVDPESGRRSSKWAWVAYVAATILAAYMSFEALLIVPAQLLSLMSIRRRSRVAISAVAIAGLACVPLLVLADRRGSSQLFWVPKPNLTQLHLMVEALLSAGLQPNFHLAPSGESLLVLSGALVLAAAAAIVAPLRRGGDRAGAATGGRPSGWDADRRALWPELLVLCWLVVPVGLGVLESYLIQPITLPRVALVSLPAASLLLAWAAMNHRVPRLLGFSAVGVVLVLRALELAPTYGVSPENWRAATAHVLAGARPGDCIAFYPSDGRQAFSYYIGAHTAAAARAPRSVLPTAPWSTVKPYVEEYTAPSSAALSRIESSCPRLWFVSSHRGQKNGPSASRSDYVHYEALLGSLTGAYARHRTVSYGWASPVRVELFSR